MSSRWVQLALSAFVAGCGIPVDVGGSQRCEKDAECPLGAICSGGQCLSCPDAGACRTPLNLQPLQRNGCPSCEFAPPSQCEGDAYCNSPTACVKGLRCAPGCAELSCCANACAEPGCTGDAPIGCQVVCPAFLSCQRCVAAKCACTGGQWRCFGQCTDPDFSAGCQAVSAE